MPNSNSDTAFFGHPRGLSTLFFTEMWERFSYYGLRAILLLYITDPGGLGFSLAKGSAILAIYASMNYMLSLPGGWLADQFLGLRRAVIFGGLLIAAGNASLTLAGEGPFYLGLALIILGTGLLKPNVSTIVGTLYSKEDSRRDAGFSIYYMGINLGALLAPLIVGYVAQRINWRYGFAISGLFMLIGVVQFILESKHLPQKIYHPVPAGTQLELESRRRTLRWGGGAALALVIALAIAQVNPEQIADLLGLGILALVVVVLSYLFFKGSPDAYERRRLAVVCILFLISTVFWACFEQAASTLNLFADKNTRNVIFGYEFPSTWYQSLNSIFLIAMAPLFAALWVKLGDRQPSVPAKFAFGLVGVGLGFLILVPAASLVPASPLWLVALYAVHSMGELCLSPVGLSAMTRLAPDRMGGFIMGVFFLSISAGNYIAGRVGGLYESLPLGTLFLYVALIPMAIAALFALFVKPVARMMEQPAPASK